jgi:hypothetical protein
VAAPVLIELPNGPTALSAPIELPNSPYAFVPQHDRR